MSSGVRSIDWSSIKRLLVALPSWVGDVTMATPFLTSIRRDSRLSGTQFTGYMRPGLDQLVDGCGLLDEMIVGRPGGVIGPWKEGTRLAGGQFDAAILLPNSWRMAATVWLARVKRRIGYDREARGWMLTHRLPCPVPGGWQQPIPAIDYYLFIAKSLEIPAADRRMRLCSSQAQQEAGESILRQAGVGDGEAFAILNPGASKAEKRWPADRFAALADHLSNQHGLRVLVNGSPAERSIVDAVCQEATTNPADLVKLGISLGSLKSVASRARLLVTNDTGTRHIAAASARRVGDAPPSLGIISLFGPTDPRWAQIEYEREKQLSTKGKPIVEISLDLVCKACDEVLGLPD